MKQLQLDHRLGPEDITWVAGADFGVLFLYRNNCAQSYPINDALPMGLRIIGFRMYPYVLRPSGSRSDSGLKSQDALQLSALVGL